MRLAAIGACAGALLAAATTADAGGSGSFVVIGFGGSADQPIRETDVPVHLTGDVQVDFHGDPAAGCEARRVCDMSGRTSWTPQGQATLLVSEFRVHGRREVYAALAVTGETEATRTVARVERRPSGAAPATCTDARSEFGTFFELPAGTAGVTVGLNRPSLGQTIFPTRCGGPLDSDVTGVLPARRLRLAAVRRGGWALDLSSSRSFSTHGLSGTVVSSVKMRAEPGETSSGPGQSQPPRGRQLRRRVAVRYRVERVAGTVAASFAGLTDESLCAPLGACGTSGTVRVEPRATGGVAELDAVAPARLPAREVRAAVGLAGGGRGRGIQVFGNLDWTRGAGAATTNLAQGGALACADTVPLSRGSLILAVGTRTVRATYGESGYEPDPLESRCPGPRLADVNSARPLAEGTLPLRAFGQRRVVLHLRTGGPFSGDGYRGRTAPDLVVVLRRVRVTEQTYAAYG
ncbi:MAG: hypothetical protein M3155_05035 [Actinomycetota bacterium]|nr:hypothetical protein [Actinomycetota bacterium]